MSSLLSRGRKSAAPNASLYVKPQLMGTMPATSFSVPINLQESRMTEVAQNVADTLRDHARDYEHACAQFTGNPDDLVFSMDGFHFVDGGGFAANPTRGAAIPREQMRNKLSLLGIGATTTLCVAHRVDIERAIGAIKA